MNSSVLIFISSRLTIKQITPLIFSLDAEYQWGLFFSKNSFLFSLFSFSTFNFQLSTFIFQPSSLNPQLSTLNSLLSTIFQGFRGFDGHSHHPVSLRA